MNTGSRYQTRTCDFRNIRTIVIVCSLYFLYIHFVLAAFSLLNSTIAFFLAIPILVTTTLLGLIPGAVSAVALLGFNIVAASSGNLGGAAGGGTWINYISAAALGWFAGGFFRVKMSHASLSSISGRAYSELRKTLEQQEKYCATGTWESDIDFHPTRISGGLRNLLGITETDIIRFQFFIERTHPEDRDLFETKLRELKRTGHVAFEHRILEPEGTVRTVLHRIREKRETGTVITGFYGILQDVTDFKTAENEIRKLNTALQHSRGWIVITNSKGKIEYVNRAVMETTGFTYDEILEKGIDLWKSGIHSPDFYRILWETLFKGEQFSGLFICRKKNAELFYLDQVIIPVRDTNGRILYYIGAGKDVTQTKQMEEKLNHLAYYDVLTNLPNRHLFSERLRHAITAALKNTTSVAVISLDINRFRLINDSFGQKTGDEVLKAVAARLSVCMRDGDTVARLGNDQWGIVLTEIQNRKSAIQAIKFILQEAGKPVAVDGEEIVLSLSAGVAMYPDDGLNPMELIRNTEIALLGAKAEGKNKYQFFTPDLNSKASDFIQMERDLFRAVENQEFIIYYQPYFDLNDLSCIAMEALLRWKRKGKRIILPGDFIPILEETGMIVEVGMEVIRMTAAQIRSWLAAGYPVKPISINLSAVQFRQRNLAESIDTVIREFGIDPGYIIFEITETTFMQDIDHTRSTLSKLRDIGFKLSIDDFGTGYSSLSYLKRFPVNTLKIDKSFISDLTKRGDDLSIVRAIISMAKSLNLKTVAEGVQDREVLSILKDESCDFAQGFYFSPPVPADVIERTLLISFAPGIPGSGGISPN